jgi:hypothetical protein
MKKNTSIKIDGVSINKEFVASFENEKAFLDAMSDKTHAHIYEGKNREAKLKEVYAKVHAKEAAPKGADSPKA